VEVTVSKKPTMVSVFLLFLLIFCSTQSSAASLPFFSKEGSPPSLAPMLEKVLPGVVNISTKSHVRIQENPLFNDPFFRRFFNVPQAPRERETQSLGSGVIVDADKGYIITNYHVINKADEITVTLRDRRSFTAKLIGKDPEADLAVVQIEAKNLSAVSLGDSEKMRIGDFVVAIGNPFGLGQTVTSGIVSALGRTGLGIEGYEDFIQTDASINPGNSGGALVNLQGKLVGINTAIVGPSGGNVGIGFAIPSNMAKGIMSQLIRYGAVRRGQLGVFIQDLTPELAQAFDLNVTSGVVVSQVMKGSPAEKSGIKSGDVITAINDEPVHTSAELRNAIGLLRAGAKISIDLLRDGKKQHVETEITEPKQTKAEAGDIDALLSGATLAPIQPDHPLAGRVEGVEVTEVKPGSSAWQAGLRKGDIIVSVNRQQVASVADIREAVKLTSKGILLNIRRGEGALFIVIK
jgi:Do/DeqQ family serine protease